MLELPTFPTLVKKLLSLQLYPHSELSFLEALEAYHLAIDDKIHTFNSATSTFRAPCDTSGIYGMCCEIFMQHHHGEVVLPDMIAFLSTQIQMLKERVVSKSCALSFFFSFQHQSKTYLCALVQWYSYIREEPDEDTGLWKIEPDTDDDGSPHLGIAHVEAIYRAVHLMPAYCTSKFMTKPSQSTLHSTSSSVFMSINS